MKPGPPRRRRARPVADAPIGALLERADDLAKGWLLAVLEAAPLEDAPAIMAGNLPTEGPLLCAAVARSLAGETELQRLEAGGELEPLAARAGQMVGARGVADTARAVEALHAVIWSGLREEVSYADSDLVSELAERLALVIELVRMAALTGHAAAAPPPPEAEASPPRPAAVAPPEPTPEPPRPAAAAPPPPESPVAPPAAGDPSALWLTAFEDEISHAATSGAPLSLLLADLEDAERVIAVEPDGDANPTFGRFAQAVRSAVRRQDILACETDSRAWIIARDTARAGAQALGGRIAQAVTEAGPWRGAPLRVSVGLAVFREDGEDSATLVEAAEEASFAAAASGIGIVRSGPSPEPSDDGPRLVS